MSLGLPELNIAFKTKAVTAIQRSARGIVACVLKDDTAGGENLSVYKSVLEVDHTLYSEDNHNLLKLIYDGGPSKVIVLKVSAATSYQDALKKIKDLKFNYLTLPGIEPADLSIVTAWVKEMREQKRKTIKVVLPNIAADHEGIINFTTDHITSTITGKTHATTDYCARIAGLLAGLSLARSSTFFVLNDITAADVPENPDELIDKGELIIIFDGEKYKIGRGVNSFVSFTPEKGEDIRKIKIVEGMDLYNDDIRDVFEDSYIGKVINDYDHKQAFVAAIGAYHRGLEGDVLDRSFENTVAVDLEAQKNYLESRGTDTSIMTEIQILQANTGSKVFLGSNVKFVDAMEDLDMTVNM